MKTIKVLSAEDWRTLGCLVKHERRACEKSPDASKDSVKYYQELEDYCLQKELEVQ